MTQTDLRVLGCIGYHLDENNEAWPAQTTIASDLGITREAANRSVRKLRLKGYITVENRSRKNGAHTSPIYRVILDPPRSTAQQVDGGATVTPMAGATRDQVITSTRDQAITGGCDQADTGGVIASDHRGCDHGDHTYNELLSLTPHLKHTSRPSGRDTPAKRKSSSKKAASPQAASDAAKATFDAIWAMWPRPGIERSDSKAKVLEEVRKAIAVCPRDQLIEAARAFVAKTEARYVPGLQRWLRNGKFEHFAPQAPRAEVQPGLPLDDSALWLDAVRRWQGGHAWPIAKLGPSPTEDGFRGPSAAIDLAIDLARANSTPRYVIDLMSANLERLNRRAA